jgi:hypothetical protein
MSKFWKGAIFGFVIATFCSMVVLGEITNRVNYMSHYDFDGYITDALQDTYSNPIAGVSISTYNYFWKFYKCVKGD